MKLLNKNLLQGLIFSNKWSFGRLKFPLPDLGEKIKEGTVKKLYVKEGQKVEEFEKIADVQSDKQFTEITAPEDGVIAKIYYQETEVCKVGDLFLEIETQDQGSTAANQPSKKPIKQPSKQPEIHNKQQNKAQHVGQTEILASGVVKMYAKAFDADLSKVEGSGRKGRILKEDILDYIQKNNLKQTPPKRHHQNVPHISQVPRAHVSLQTRTIRMNPYQQGMQKSMTAANKVPHLYLHEKVDLSELEAMRQKLKESKVRVTMTGLLIKTFSIALQSNPRMNSTYDPEKSQFSFETHSSHNISIAIDSPNGLVAPNIKNVQSLSILEIQEKINELKTQADQAKLTRDQLQGGTICLSNIGTIGGVSACPLLVCPQICIIAIGKIVQTPVFYNGIFHKKSFMTLSYGCDHRVVDGASVARFSNDWKSVLQNPYLAMVKMH